MRVLDTNPDEGVPAAKAHIFCRLEQMITPSNLQPFEGASPIYFLQSAAYHNLQAQLFHAGLNGAIKALTKDSELFKSTKETHSKEVKTLKAKIAKLNASITEEQGSAKKLAEELKSAREDALKEFRELEEFHEEAMPMPMCTLGMWSISGWSDAQKEIFELLKARDRWLIAEDGQGDTIVTEEEDPSVALQLNRRCSRSSDRDPPTGPMEDEAMEVPQSEA
nr:hypothetical protein Iba_scaffold29485CG0020 [Ipomoea batatas]GMD08072.1 hypothetical protein Iba_chr06cCG13210 [Ipomoea batatas]